MQRPDDLIPWMSSTTGERAHKQLSETPSPWPRLGGTYVLLIEVTVPREIVAGHLGRHTLTPGIYAYVGSAYGPGGLQARLARHLRPEKKLHWHIDYLLTANAASVVAVYARADATRRECAWVRRLLALPGAVAPIPRFGAGDCREGCPAHLLRLPALPDPARLEEMLRDGEARLDPELA
jgi:Uri superfamily endonuclease